MNLDTSGQCCYAGSAGSAGWGVQLAKTVGVMMVDKGFDEVTLTVEIETGLPEKSNDCD